MLTHTQVLSNFLKDLSQVVIEILDVDIYEFRDADIEHIGLKISSLFHRHCETLTDYGYILRYFKIDRGDIQGLLSFIPPLDLVTFHQKFRNEGGGHVLLNRLRWELMSIDINYSLTNPF